VQFNPPPLQGPGVELAINLQLAGREQFTAEGALWIINSASQMKSQSTDSKGSTNS